MLILKTNQHFLYDFLKSAEVRKKGLNLKPSLVTGRMLLSPTDIVKEFSSEYGTDKQQLDFVFFLDGIEAEGRAIERGVEEFLESWQRPKYDFFQE